MLGQRSPYTGREIEEVVDERYVLLDADGDKVGDIVELGPEYAVARKDGGLFGEERVYYVPRKEIAREDGTDWYLSIDKDVLDDMDWSQRPETSTAEYDSPGSNDADGRVEGQGVRLVRYEEELQAQKTSQQAGEAVVRKEVVEEVQTIEVPVRREELRIERRPVTDRDAPSAPDQTFTGDTIRVPLMEEQVQIQKVARPVEEIEIGKVAMEETKRVEETVRKERFDIDDTQVSERDPDEPTDR